jgi:GWxTD domain-containing protein
MLRPLLAALTAFLVCAPPLAAQQDISDLFDLGSFYESAGVLRARGDIPFFADLSYLRTAGDSTQVLLGIALSNSAFQFLKQPDGYRAEYAVELELKGGRGSFRNTWHQEVKAQSFDETVLDRETIVFQSSFALLPGDYDLDLEVRDAQSGESSKVESKVDVPALAPAAGGYALSKPVLLRFFDKVATTPDRGQVLYPSHYYASVPEDVSFFAEVYAAGDTTAGPLKLVASIASDQGGAALSTATFDVPPLQNGSARVYGQVPGTGMVSGIYRLSLSLQGPDGRTLAESSAKMSVSAITQWVQDHWKDALELIAYEASKSERDRLEDTPADRRLEAWKEFWRVRDPVPATPNNEEFEDYFQRIAVANANFGTKLRPGWKSDRGRVYVAFGAPNDIIRRPLEPNGFPVEIWIYDSPGFEIDFEDRIGFGNYQIANPGTFVNELAALQRRKERAIEARREAERRGEEGQEESAPAAPAASPDSVSNRAATG